MRSGELERIGTREHARHKANAVRTVRALRTCADDSCNLHKSIDTLTMFGCGQRNVHRVQTHAHKQTHTVNVCGRMRTCARTLANCNLIGPNPGMTESPAIVVLSYSSWNQTDHSSERSSLLSSTRRWCQHDTHYSMISVMLMIIERVVADEHETLVTIHLHKHLRIASVQNFVFHVDFTSWVLTY